MLCKYITLAAVFMASTASAHMHMTNPAPLGSKDNKYSPPGQIDYDYDAPLDRSGSNFPCKGKLSMLSGPGGKAVASWQGGSQQSFTIAGGAAHNGGSCQASISKDQGATWKVVKSYIGNCPTSGGGQFSFTVPDISGDVLFAWSWFNKVGNREMYMDCAAVNVVGTGTDNLSSLPDMFVANIGNGCSTTENVDLEFPNPGKSVERNSQKTGPPVGNCAVAVKGASIPSSDSSAPSSPSPVPSSLPAPVNSTSSAPETGPSRKFDDGLYHPSKPDNSKTGATNPTDSKTSKPADSTGAESPAGNGSGTGKDIVKAQTPEPSTGPSPAPSEGDVYDIYMDIDGKKMKGTATLRKQVPGSKSQYRRRAIQFRA